MQFSFAQEKTVTGVVSDKTGPIPGANIVVKGSTRSAQTDIDGKFSIKAKQGEVLVISFVGMNDATATVGAASTVNIKMQDGVNLEEVVVLGYNQAKRKNEATGNYVKVSGTELSKVPVVSVDQALQGKVAGLTVATTSGTPGSTQNVRIRGLNSLNAGNEPLYVIDGVPVVSGNVSGDTTISSLSILSTISSDNIESITVLKDASATSPFGARGTNGVILITTKRGKNGKTKFSLTSTTGFQNNAVNGLRELNGAEKKTLLEDAVFNTYGDFGNVFNRDQAYQYIVDNGISQPLIDWVDAGSKEYNWGKLIKNKDARLTSLNFSAQGGDDKQSFYASLGYNKTEGTVIGADFKRITGSLNYTSKLTDKIKFTNAVNFSNAIQNGILEQSAYFANPNLTRYFMNPWVNPYNAAGTLNTTMEGTSLFNTIYQSQNDVTRNDLIRIVNNSGLTYNLTNKLRFTSNFGVDYSINNYRNFQNPVHGGGFDTNGYVEESIDKTFKYVAQNSFDYNFKLGEKHSFETKVLMEFDKTVFTGLYGYGENLSWPTFQYINGTSANWDSSSYYQDAANLAYLGMVNYKFSDKYVLDLSFRNEASSRFNEDKRRGDFYSIGAAWNINRESFLANVEQINSLRLRGSYGTTGNAAVGLNQYQSALGSGSYNGGPTLAPSTYGGQINWEKGRKLDIGVDFELFKNRVKGSIVYYKSISSEMLQPTYPLSPTQGFDSYATNAGVMFNKGLEFELNLDVIRQKDFNVSVGGNYSTLENKITDLKLANGSPLYITTGTRRNEEGHTAYEWYMRKWAGVDPATGSALWYINGIDGATTNDYNAASVAFQGKSAIPTYSGGLNLHVDLHNFFVDCGLYFAGGNKVFQDWAFYTSHTGISSLDTYNGTEDLLNRWQNPGDITDTPKAEYTPTGSNASRTSTRFLYDGDYIRLRDLTFGYSIKANILEKVGLDGLSFSVRGTNLVTWVKDSRLKYDPEVQATGFTALTSPPVKSVVFSVNVKF